MFGPGCKNTHKNRHGLYLLITNHPARPACIPGGPGPTLRPCTLGLTAGLGRVRLWMSEGAAPLALSLVKVPGTTTKEPNNNGY